MNKIDSLNIFGVNVSKLTYQTFLDCIKENIQNKDKLTIAYANAASLNKTYGNDSLINIFNSFDLVHPDGIGVYLALRFLYGKKGLENRLTGSDFYPLLINESIKNNWKYFFFGHSMDILKKIKERHPRLNISGLSEGYEFESSKVITEINRANPDIIIIGLSCPVQEKWIYENKERINYKIILTVGDGIKVFVNKKIRGPLFVRSLGLEWVIRYLMNPVSNFRKYVIGVPLFILRTIKEKLK